MKTKTDYRLLYFYSDNCRVSFSSIAKKLRKSPQIVKYSINQLEKQGIIPFYYTVIDYSLFNMLLFRVYFRGGYSGGPQLNSLIKKLVENPSVVSIYEIGGQYDLIVEFMAENPSRFNKELKSIVAENPELNNHDIIINVVSHIYPRNYLLGKKKTNYAQPLKEIIVGGDRKFSKISKNEKKVLIALVENPKERITSIALKLKINAKTAIASMKSLQENKIIRGYKGSIKTGKIGVMHNRITLKLHNIDPLKEKQLMNFCINAPQITRLNKTIGQWDIEIDSETFSQEEFRKIYLTIREEFKDIIMLFNSYRVYNKFKHKYINQEKI
jgi:DNA-binding Lrp family transcriptional regulator